jgi:hypothetical protein
MRRENLYRRGPRKQSQFVRALQQLPEPLPIRVPVYPDPPTMPALVGIFLGFLKAVFVAGLERDFNIRLTFRERSRDEFICADSRHFL